MSHLEINPEADSQTRPTTAVIEAIAEHEGVDPLDLEQPLAEVVDTDALDSILDHVAANPESSDITVRFSYNGCRVRVSDDGTVAVSSQSE